MSVAGFKDILEALDYYKKHGIDPRRQFDAFTVSSAMKDVCGFKESLITPLFYFGYTSEDCNESLADKISNQCESETSGKGCYVAVLEGTQEFCKFTNGEARPCKWLDNLITTTKSTTTTLIIGIVCGVISLLISGTIIFLWYRRRKEASVQEGETTGSVSGEVKSTTKKTVSGY